MAEIRSAAGKKVAPSSPVGAQVGYSLAKHHSSVTSSKLNASPQDALSPLSEQSAILSQARGFWPLPPKQISPNMAQSYHCISSEPRLDTDCSKSPKWIIKPEQRAHFFNEEQTSNALHFDDSGSETGECSFNDSVGDNVQPQSVEPEMGDNEEIDVTTAEPQVEKTDNHLDDSEDAALDLSQEKIENDTDSSEGEHTKQEVEDKWQ